jgi:hypothetical protein
MTNSITKPATYNIDRAESVTWNRREYNRHMIANFVGFIIWLVKDDWFIVNIEGYDFTVRIHYDGFSGWFCTTSNYDGPEDGINSNHSLISREDALEGLVEKISEAMLTEGINL